MGLANAFYAFSARVSSDRTREASWRGLPAVQYRRNQAGGEFEETAIGKSEGGGVTRGGKNEGL